jgi:hypothetical protein
MTQPEQASDAADPRHYQILCGLALGFVVLTQVEHGFLFGTLLVGVAGLVGILARWRGGPLLFLAMVGVSQSAPAMLGYVLVRQSARSVVDINSLLFAAGVLIYVAGLYRLQALWHNILPLDPRQRAGPLRRGFPWFTELPDIVPHRREPGSLTRREIGFLLLTAAIAVGLAQVIWLALAAPPAQLEMPVRLWQAVLLAWALLTAWFVVAQILLLRKRRRLLIPAALMLLQDELWTATRGDQRRAQRWLAWHRVRQRERP